MSKTGDPQGQRFVKEFTSSSSATPFTDPSKYPEWVQIVGAGTTVVICEDGNTPTFTTDAAEPSLVLPGVFKAFTSTTATRVRMGNGPPPPASPVPATNAYSNTLTTATTIGAAVDEMEQTLHTSQGVIPIDLKAAILAAGTPMAAFANNSSSNPGITLDNSKAVGIRWNNNATQTPIWTQVPIPLDMDVTKASIFVVLASKSGATSGDATTFDIGCYEQVPAALEDAGSNLGGTTTALSGAATAKTVSKLTLAIAANTFTAPPGVLSISIQPTNGTLGTDDAVCNGFYLQYQKKILTS